ncbi:MAG: hypothetical protein JRJ58_18775, partial [Deltaproteobacteria bacterium]|nr:hypothetical protein [Deltaproteobacteria bacterium]
MLSIVPDLPSSLRATVGSLVSAFALCAVVVVAVAHADTRAAGETPPQPSPETILSAIERLESDHDAKCHSTASRFEDFLFGTPLSAEARLAHDEAKQRVALRLWSAASQSASKAGDAMIEARHIDREAAAIAVPTQQDDGRVRLEFAAGRAVELEARRVEQYASIAYSLRAVLVVDQDQLLGGGDPLRPLSREGLDALVGTLDLLSLAALEIADRDARARNEFEVTKRSLISAWARVAPTPDVMAGSDSRAAAPGPAIVRAQSLALLERIASGKLSAYQRYNDIDGEEAHKLLVFNINRFYARQPLSRYRTDRRSFVAALRSRLASFAGELLRVADERARTAGHRLIRAGDAKGAAQQLVPQRIDEFEDVHVFPSLAADERITLEAFDCDSMRDFALHWRALLRAARAAPEPQRQP